MNAPDKKIDKTIIIDDTMPFGDDHSDTQVHPFMDELADQFSAEEPVFDDMPETPIVTWAVPASIFSNPIFTCNNFVNLRFPRIRVTSSFHVFSLQHVLKFGFKPCSILCTCFPGDPQRANQPEASRRTGR